MMDIEKLIEEQRERDAEQDALERDAARYRALREHAHAAGLTVDFYRPDYAGASLTHHVTEFVASRDELDVLADRLIAEQTS